MVPSRHHDILLKMGYIWHEDKQYYTDANGNIIPQEIEFNENGHYFDGQHYRDAYGNIVDHLYPHLALLNAARDN